jgi:hypothetical protein
MGFTKIELVKLLKYYVKHLDLEKLNESHDKLYFTANKWKLETLSIEELAKRSTKDYLNQLIFVFSQYQKGGIL